ncbi:alpha-E domain-containing protein [Candidatus Blastococcus massiliensis]|uniref:alpha-E domain-containing protein n=1 Tax=Candidatus Blastococcus massiliensis TaxID=1470358 RepID=UPI0004B1D550|nr:alpha-E domain-containing protein [Candidatus Blastococcus massiliensis]
MLSRIAESLFWIGRYVERADDTSRILDVHTQRLVEDPWIDERRACANLLALMGAPDAVGVEGREEAQPEADTERVLAALAFDRTSPSSIVGALSAARENARGAREVLSAEIWESLNVTHNALPQQRTMARRYGPHSLFRFVRERSAMVFGLADATMSRDESWLFLILGRSLERIDMTSRMLSTRVLAGDAAPSWTLVLRSTGAYEPYLRTYRGVVDSSRAAEFLLLDRLFPRSVFASLVQAEACLAELERSTVRDAARIGVAGEAHRIVGRARTMLEFMSTPDLLAQLPARLEELQRTCSAASAAVTHRFFTEQAPQVWVPEEAG